MKVNYKETHGKDFRLPRPVLNLVREGLLEDVSYANDEVPSFRTGQDRNGRELIVYVNATDRHRREDPDLKQFYVCSINPETDSSPKDLLFTNDFNEVMMAINRHALASPEMLGLAFVRCLEIWLDKPTRKLIAGKNVEYAAASEDSFCATGDYCDSNMAMDYAFKSFDPDYDVDVSSQDDVDLWNAAWDCGKELIAKRWR